MSSSIRQQPSSVPVRTLENIRPASAKAGLPSDQIGPNYTAELHAAILAYYGSVKATAYALGEGAGKSKLDESLMQREFKAGNFERFNDAAICAKSAVTLRMNTVFGELMDPDDFALRSLDRIESEVKELRQYVIQRKSA